REDRRGCVRLLHVLAAVRGACGREARLDRAARQPRSVSVPFAHRRFRHAAAGGPGRHRVDLLPARAVSVYSCDFARSDGFAGFTRLELREHEGVAWYWTYLVGVPGVEGIIAVRDHEVPLPRQRLEIRTDGLWAELVCETPGEHWTFGLEAL